MSASPVVPAVATAAATLPPDAAGGGGKRHADVTVLTRALVDQLEYYFSTLNLWTDQFMQNEIAKDPEGFVSVDVLRAFPRIKALTSDPSMVVCALKQSTKIVLSADNARARRAVPMAARKPTVAKALVVTGIPADVTDDQLTARFACAGALKFIWPWEDVVPTADTAAKAADPPADAAAAAPGAGAAAGADTAAGTGASGPRTRSALIEFASARAAATLAALIQRANGQLTAEAGLATLKAIQMATPNTRDAPVAVAAATTAGSPAKPRSTQLKASSPAFNPSLSPLTLAAAGAATQSAPMPLLSLSSPAKDQKSLVPAPSPSPPTLPAPSPSPPPPAPAEEESTAAAEASSAVAARAMGDDALLATLRGLNAQLFAVYLKSRTGGKAKKKKSKSKGAGAGDGTDAAAAAAAAGDDDVPARRPKGENTRSRMNWRVDAKDDPTPEPPKPAKKRGAQHQPSLLTAEPQLLAPSPLVVAIRSGARGAGTASPAPAAAAGAAAAAASSSAVAVAASPSPTPSSPAPAGVSAPSAQPVPQGSPQLKAAGSTPKLNARAPAFQFDPTASAARRGSGGPSALVLGPSAAAASGSPGFAPLNGTGGRPKLNIAKKTAGASPGPAPGTGTGAGAGGAGVFGAAAHGGAGGGRFARGPDEQNRGFAGFARGKRLPPPPQPQLTSAA